jgi:hypothetical protein
MPSSPEMRNPNSNAETQRPQRGKAATKAAVEPVAGCRLKVAGWLPKRSVNLQPPTCNLQLRRSLRASWTIAVQRIAERFGVSCIRQFAVSCFSASLCDLCSAIPPNRSSLRRIIVRTQKIDGIITAKNTKSTKRIPSISAIFVFFAVKLLWMRRPPRCVSALSPGFRLSVFGLSAFGLPSGLGFRPSDFTLSSVPDCP